jgi:phage terminase large subunit-like protein
MGILNRPHRKKTMREGQMKQRATLMAGLLVLSSLFTTTIMFPGGNGESQWLSSSHSGFNGTGRLFNDTMLDGTGEDARVTLLRAGDWFDQKPVTSPQIASNYAIAAIGENDRILLFGGYSSSLPLNQTWVYDTLNNSWNQVMPARSPPARSYLSMATIWNDDKVILFGGKDSNWNYLDDTWIYDLSENQWILLNLSTHPSARIGHGMASVRGASKVVLFGGNDKADTWIFDTVTYQWAEANPTGNIPPYGGGEMAPIWNDDKIVLYRNDGAYSTWVYDIGTNAWSWKMPTNPPTDMNWPALASIPGDDKVILFDGGNARTWIFDLSENRWYQRRTLGTPPMMYGSGLATVESSRTVILFASEQTFVYDLSAYADKGYYLSAYHDANNQSRLIKITWRADVPLNCTLKFQVRSGSSIGNLILANFTGPDGTPGTFYIEQFNQIADLPVNRWVQYEAFLSTADPKATPSILEVNITYNQIPKAPILTTPDNQTWTNRTYPVFSWSFVDNDSTQGGFEWQMGVSSDIFPPILSSGDRDSNETSYTAVDPVQEGTWFWHVRTRDTDGDWGLFSESRPFGVDITKPAGFEPQAIPAGWSALSAAISFSTTDNLSGVAGYQVILDGMDNGLQISPYMLPELPDGLHRVDVRAYDLAGNYAEGWTRVLVDRTPPRTFVPEVSPSNWSSVYPVISFSTTDNTSGIDHYELSINGGTFARQTSPFTPSVLPPGESSVTIRAFDRAGNYCDGIAMVRFDMRPPSDVYGTIIPASWTNQDPWLKVHVRDPDSGLGRVEVSVVKNVYSADGDTVLVPGLPEGVNTVRFKVYDRVGNAAEGSAIAYIDRTPPMPFQPGASPSGWQKECPRISYNAQDNLSGVDHYEISVDGGPYSQRARSGAVMQLPDGVHNITVRAFDKAGNHRDGNVTVFIDSRPPVNVSLHINWGADSTRQPAVNLAIAASDDISGPCEMSLSNDGISYGRWEPFRTSRDWALAPGRGEKEVFLRVRDRAGNEAAVASATINYEPDPWAQLAIPLSVSALLLVAIVAAIAFLGHRARKRRARERAK